MTGLRAVAATGRQAGGRRSILILLFMLGLTVAFSGCSEGQEAGPVGVAPPTPSATAEADPAAVRYLTVAVIDSHPHDQTLYTQGLEFVDGLLLESSGLREQSSIRLYDPTNGSVVDHHDLDESLFAEGATLYEDQVWQLTWTSEKAIVYDLDALEPIREVSYEGEGWGLCVLDGRFVMSNGGDALTFRSPGDFGAVGSVPVTLADVGSIGLLNELECVDDGTDQQVWANSYRSTFIYGIDPDTGRVTDVVDASSLVPAGLEGDTDLVLNGIAVHPETGHFWLTGKEWPVLYEVEFVES